MSLVLYGLLAYVSCAHTLYLSISSTAFPYCVAPACARFHLLHGARTAPVSQRVSQPRPVEVEGDNSLAIGGSSKLEC